MSDRPGEMDERDVDARFASIVAGWEARQDPAGGSPGESPSEEPRDTAAGERAEDSPEPGPGPAGDGAPDDDAPGPARSAWVNPSPLDGLVPASSWRVAPPPSAGDGEAAPTASVAEDDDEHFEPPAVELPPQEDLHFWGAVIGLVAGPLCLVYVAMARPFHSTRWFLAGLALSLLGFALLILRQPRERDHGDDGARI